MQEHKVAFYIIFTVVVPFLLSITAVAMTKYEQDEYGIWIPDLKDLGRMLQYAAAYKTFDFEDILKQYNGIRDTVLEYNGLLTRGSTMQIASALLLQIVGVYYIVFFETEHYRKCFLIFLAAIIVFYFINRAILTALFKDTFYFSSKKIDNKKEKEEIPKVDYQSSYDELKDYFFCVEKATKGIADEAYYIKRNKEVNNAGLIACVAVLVITMIIKITFFG